MNDKKIVEAYKTVRAEQASLPKPLPPEAILDIQNTINDGLAKALKDPKPETRSLAEIISDIENEPSKSRDRKELELRICHIADRIKDHYEPKQEPLHL